ncbi:MAG: glycosyl hydrolase family 28-related protein [Flavobacteriaceae bacterium]|nr:glycosyl hydrolase family 28-related protein [Flavobacteriaceae bacterium]
MNVILPIVFILFTACASTPIKTTSQKVINVKDFGAKGDGITNDYLSFKNAVEAINKQGGGKLEIPLGHYLLNTYSTGKEDKSLVFQNCKQLEIEGNNSIMELKGDFHRKVTRTGAKHKFSTDRSLVPLLIQNCKDVRISNLVIDGNVDQMSRDASIVEAAGHLVMIRESRNVVLYNLELHHAMSDGLVLGGNNIPSMEITIDRVISRNNGRQALTIGYAQDVMIKNSEFSYTGITEGNYGHHAPAAGLDIEPNREFQKVKNITFENCTFKNNMGSEAVINHISTTDGVVFKHCHFESSPDSSRKWEIIVNAKNVNFHDCTFVFPNGSIYPTWHKDGSSAGFYNCYIKSGDAGILAVSFNPNSTVIVDNCILEYTGKEVIERYFPYIRMPGLSFTNNVIKIPGDKIKGKRVDGLIEEVKLYKNNRIESSGNNKPRISTTNAKTK